MDNEDNQKFISKGPVNTRKGSRYENRKLLYIVLLIFILLNIFSIPFRGEIEIDMPSQIENNNLNNNINNQIKEQQNNTIINK